MSKSHPPTPEKDGLDLDALRRLAEAVSPESLLRARDEHIARCFATLGTGVIPPLESAALLLPAEVEFRKCGPSAMLHLIEELAALREMKAHDDAAWNRDLDEIVRLRSELAALRESREAVVALADQYDGFAEHTECSLDIEDRRAAHEARDVAKKIRKAVGAP